MKAKLVLLFSFVAVCLVLAIATSLPARQLGPPTGQRVPPPSPAPKPTTPHPAPDLEGRCNQLLFSAFMKDSGSANPFRAAADLELISDMVLARKCIALPNIDIRLAAFDAYVLLRDEEEFRESQHTSDDYWSMVNDNTKATMSRIVQDAEKDVKQQADFAEVAKFAVALYKQNEQYKERAAKLASMTLNLTELYRQTYNREREVIKVLSQPADRQAVEYHYLFPFIEVRQPPVMRVETPPVPRALQCTAHTWTDCW